MSQIGKKSHGKRNAEKGLAKAEGTMGKNIDQLIDKEGHLIEFIHPCAGGNVLVRWFTDVNTLKTQQLLPKDKAAWVKQGLLRNGYHQT
jgi:hypothetical protein